MRVFRVFHRMQRGAALIAALMVTALAAVIATALLTMQSSVIRQTQQLLTSDQLRAYLDGVVYWAEDVIVQDLESGMHWGLLKKGVLPAKTMEDGVVVRGRLVDAQQYLNINALSVSMNESVFATFFKRMGIDDVSSKLRDLRAFITQDTALDDRYEAFVPPYQPPHQWMADKTELRAVYGFDAKLYRLLSPALVALPNDALHVNVNTASNALLTDLVGEKAAAAMLACRAAGPIKSQFALQKCVQSLQGDQGRLNRLAFHTQYFLVYATASRGSRRLQLTALLYLHKLPDHKAMSVSVVWERLS